MREEKVGRERKEVRIAAVVGIKREREREGGREKEEERSKRKKGNKTLFDII